MAPRTVAGAPAKQPAEIHGVTPGAPPALLVFPSVRRDEIARDEDIPRSAPAPTAVRARSRRCSRSSPRSPLRGRTSSCHSSSSRSTADRPSASRVGLVPPAARSHADAEQDQPTIARACDVGGCGRRRQRCGGRDGRREGAPPPPSAAASSVAADRLDPPALLPKFLLVGDLALDAFAVPRVRHPAAGIAGSSGRPRPAGPPAGRPARCR